MLVQEARDRAREWVAAEAAGQPGFVGVVCHGSTNWLPDDAVFPAASDFDLLVFWNGDELPAKPGKVLHNGVLLEPTYLSSEEIASPEEVLGSCHLAGSFRAPHILADPVGVLGNLQVEVARGYAQSQWVMVRCERAMETVRNVLTALKESAPLHNQVTSVHFAAGITTHVLLSAGLRNPTVRKRYAAVRELLIEYGFPEFYEKLLELGGMAHQSRQDVVRHLEALAEAYDAAKTFLRTPYRFAADLTEASRPVVIDGSRELIALGLHREALFWMVAVYCRCRHVLAQDAPADIFARHDVGFQRLVEDIGLSTFADRKERAAKIEDMLPRVWEVATAIRDANPAVTDKV